MKNKTTFILVLAMFCNIFLFAQTSGTLNYSVKITEPTGGYNNKLVIAIWLEDSATGSFIKTKMRYAQVEIQYLNVWIAKSGYNVVDAVTGATTSPGIFTILWNGTDVSGSQVPDGVYNVWVQFSDKNQGGPTKFCTFTKGPVPISGQTYPNSGNFTDMVLSWTPSATGIFETAGKTTGIAIYPNPVGSHTTISFVMKNEGPLSVVVYNSNGQLVKYLVRNASADAGLTSVVWDTKSTEEEVPAGIYFVKVYSTDGVKTQKIIVL